MLGFRVDEVGKISTPCTIDISFIKKEAAEFFDDLNTHLLGTKKSHVILTVLIFSNNTKINFQIARTNISTLLNVQRTMQWIQNRLMKEPSNLETSRSMDY